MTDAQPSIENLSADEIYSKFIDGEKMYGYLNNFDDKFGFKWQHFRVRTSVPAFWKYYGCPPRASSSLVGTFCPDATETLLMICSCKNLRSYQVGDLLKLRADPNCQSSENAEAPLHRLIRLCKVKAVKLIVNWGADTQCKDIKGKTPLMAACDCKENKKQLQIIRYLLESKSIDVNAWDDEGNSAATLAVRNSNIWTLRELLMSGLSVTSIGRRGRHISIDDVTASNNASVFNFTKNLRDHTSGSKKKTGATAKDLAEGVKWEDKSRLYFESMRRSKQEVCFLMIQRKASNEIIEGTMSGAIAPTVQSTVPGSILKGRNKLVLKKIVETADENESEDGKPADVAVVRVANGSSKERDKTYHEK
jgi:Ankyrin repeats (3 copies)